jgi:hypothetical protein
LRGSKGLFILIAWILILLPFQNCTQRTSFRSLSSVLALNSTQTDNGVPYDGKADASFYRFVPEFSCEGQSQAKDRIDVRDGKFFLFENHLQKCAVQSRELGLEEVVHSPLQNDSVSVKDFIYTRYDNELRTPPDSVEEVICRDDFLNPHVEIITKYNQSLKTSVTKVYSLYANMSRVDSVEDPSTLRIYSGAEIEYAAFSGDLSFKISLDQTIPGELRRYNAEVTKLQGIWSEKITNKNLVCITSLYAAPIEILPLSLSSSIRGADTNLLNSVTDHNGKLMAASVITSYSGEPPASPFMRIFNVKPSLIGIYQSLDSGMSWSQLAKVQSGPGSNSVNPILLSGGASLYLYATNSSNEVFVAESKDQGITWKTVMTYRLESASTITATGAVLSNDNHLLISGYSYSSIESTSFVRKCDLQTWSCANSDEYTSASGSSNRTTKIWRDTSGSLYISQRYGPTQMNNSTYVKKSIDNGATWTTLVQDSTGSTNINALAVSSDGQMILYGGAMGASTPYLKQSTDGGQTWITTTSVCAGWSVLSITILANKDAILTCFDYNRITAATYTAMIYKKSATATSWTEMVRQTGSSSGPLYQRPNGELYYFDYSINSPPTLQISTNSGNSWTNLTYPNGENPSLGDAQFLSVMENDLGELYAVGYVTIAPTIKNAVVYKSKDAGFSWSLDYSFGVGNSSFRSLAKSRTSNNLIVGGSQNLNVWVSHKFNSLTSTWAPSDIYTPANGALASLNQVMSGPNEKFWSVGSTIQFPAFTNRWLVRSSTDEGGSWNTLEDFQLNSGYASEAFAGTAQGSDLYVAGYANDTSSISHWLVRKYSSTGVISNDDENGFEAGAASTARGILTASDGSLYAVGEYNLKLGNKRWVVKKKPVGGQWSVIDDYALEQGADAIAYSVSEDAAYRIVVTGSAKNSNGRQFAITRVLSSSGWLTIDSYSQHALPVSLGSSACLKSQICVVGSYLNSDGMYRGFFRSFRTDGNP